MRSIVVYDPTAHLTRIVASSVSSAAFLARSRAICSAEPTVGQIRCTSQQMFPQQ